ncbi:hypothetical protein [Phreatobacter sp.]|uniref:hypothetical protein n=1 Tax=Phreatobacter sp. TaxID=1966341 RepID=UPI0022BEA24B|nr:hypothetical protein [Phreatobacter sp.]MCZ8314962.1 hypothetical protein [Phreatobacter sp.]
MHLTARRGLVAQPDEEVLTEGQGGRGEIDLVGEGPLQRRAATGQFRQGAGEMKRPAKQRLGRLLIQRVSQQQRPVEVDDEGERGMLGGGMTRGRIQGAKDPLSVMGREQSRGRYGPASRTTRDVPAEGFWHSVEAL